MTAPRSIGYPYTYYGEHQPLYQIFQGLSEEGPDLPFEKDPFRYIRKRRPLVSYVYRANLNKPTDANLVRFLEACYGGDTQEAIALLEFQDKSDQSLVLGLKLAIRDDNISLVDELLGRGVKFDGSVIKEARSVPMCELIVKHGLDLGSIGPSNNPLLTAICIQDERLTEWLITHGIRPTENHVEALAQYSTPEIFALLLHHNGSFDLSCTGALHAAAGQCYPPQSLDEKIRMIEYLLDLGLDPNKRADDERSYRLEFPLRYADRSGLTMVVKRLLEAGADPFLKDRFDKSPMDHALRLGHTELVAEYAKYRKEGIPRPFPEETNHEGEKSLMDFEVGESSYLQLGSLLKDLSNVVASR